MHIQSTPDKSDSQGTGKSFRLSEMSDLSEIKNIMQIKYIRDAQRELKGYRKWNYATIYNIKCCIQ